MASFSTVDAAVACGRAIQSGIDAFNRDSSERLQLRVGIHAGEPVEDSNDLFGTTVQIAARICEVAAPDAIVVSAVVRGLLQDPGQLVEIGSQSFKGIGEPVALYQIPWH
jgi:class 3 adenylate cyclase